MKKNILLLFIFSCFSILWGQDEVNLQKAPELKTFTTSPDLLGAIGNSVNLYTGQVNLPLTLASLSTISGLSSNVSILYSSAGIAQQMEKWNLEAPTGILGVGWVFNYPKIVRDHKMTGAREDDDFYLVEGGQSNKLICCSIDNAGFINETREYKLKSYVFWRIIWKKSGDYWEIIKEDGSRFIYGDTDESKQFCIRWGNWIGDSKTTEGNPVSHPIAWNLRKIKNWTNEEIELEYLKVEQTLIPGIAVQTEACYLQCIKDKNNNSIVLNYSEKEAQEYIEPHIEAPEPDAYQEQYEKKYLSSISICENEHSISDIRFEYQLITSTINTQKRMLTAVLQSKCDSSVSRIDFEYNSQNLGYLLKKVVLPMGSSILYEYEMKAIGHSQRALTINAPTEPNANFSEPKVFIANDYVVVVWRDIGNNGHTSASRGIKIQIYQWLGEWVLKEVPYSDLSAALIDGKYLNYHCEVQEDYFALFTHYDYHGSHTLLIGSKNNLKRGEWNFEKQQYNDDLYATTSTFQLRTTPYYILLINTFRINSGHNQFKTLRLTKSETFGWQSLLEYVDMDIFSFATANNYYLRHRGLSEFKMWYLNELCLWNYRVQNFGISSNPGSYPMLSGANSFTVFSGETYRCRTAVLGWDVDYSGESCRLINDDKSRLATNCSIYGNSLFSVDYMDPTFDNMVCRFNGNHWIASEININNYANIYSLGNDFIVRRNSDYSNNNFLYRYDANTSLWNSDNMGMSDIPVSNNSSFAITRNVWNRTNPGAFSSLGQLQTLTTSIGPVFPGYGYFAYTEWGTDYFTYVQFLKNGILGNLISIPSQTVYSTNNGHKPYTSCNLVGGNTIITYPASIADFHDVTQLTLHRVIEENGSGPEITGIRSISCVKKIIVNNGYESTTTCYDYDGTTATVDINGINPQFNRVAVIPVDKITKPNGYTESYFFNQLPSDFLPSNAQFSWSTESRYTNADTSYMMLSGQQYLQKVFAKTGSSFELVSETKSYWYLNSKKDLNELCYYPRVKKTSTDNKGILNYKIFSYNELNGLISNESDYNTSINGATESTDVFTTYAFDAYTGMAINHQLSQVCGIQKRFATGYESKFITYANSDPAYWTPHKTYVSNAREFDFQSWSNSNEPPLPTTGAEAFYQKISEITRLSGEIGVVIESKDIDGMYNSVKFGKLGQIASFVNAKYNNVFADNFDDLSLTNWTIDGTGNYGGWVISEIGELYHSTQNIEMLHIQPRSFSPDQDFNGNHYIIDYSIRMNNDVVVDNWAGIIFSKNTFDCSYSDSGYLLYMRKDAATGRAQFTLHWKKSNGTYYNSTSFNSPKKAVDWHRLRITVDNETIKVFVDGTLAIMENDNTWRGKFVSLCDYNAKALYDNVLICPGTSFGQMVSNHPVTKTILSQFDSEGMEVKTLYDRNSTPIAVINHNGVPVTITAQSRSRDRQLNNTFNALDPNLVLSTISRGEFGFFDDFSTHLQDWSHIGQTDFSSVTWEQAFSNKNMRSSLYHICDGYTGNNNNSVNAFVRSLKQPISGRIAIEFSISVGVATKKDFTGAGIAVGDGAFTATSVTGSATWGFLKYSEASNRISFVVKSGISGTETVIADWLRLGYQHRIKVVLDCTTKKASYFIDGKPCGNNFDFLTPATNAIQKIAFIDYARMTLTSGNPRTAYMFDNLLVYTEPSEAITYSDATGKEIQHQTEESDNTIIVDAQLYDEVGRPHVKTVSLRQTGWLGYLSNFVTGFNKTSGVISGLVNPTQGTNDKFPYSRSVYETSPLSRPIENGQPGIELAITPSNSHTGKITYQATDAQWPFTVPPNSFYCTKFTNADQVSTWELKDKQGRKIATQTGPVLFKTSPNATGISIYPTTLFEYDQRGNLVKIKTPNYFNNPATGTVSANGEYCITMKYDFFHRVVEKSTPNAGTTKFIYDKAGRLRFTMDANGAALNPQRFTYIKYDEFKRASEEGYCYLFNNLTWEDLVQFADQPNWPVLQ